MPDAQTHYESHHSRQSSHLILQQLQGFAMPDAQTHYKSDHSRRASHFEEPDEFAMLDVQPHDGVDHIDKHRIA